MIAQSQKIRIHAVFLEREHSIFVNLTDSPPPKISLTIPSDLQELDRVLGSFEQVYQPWIPKKDWLQCQLALAEGFTNAVRHAHKEVSPQIPINIEITLSYTKMELRIWDHGSPFDLEAFLQKNSAKENRWLGHGQGLSILKQIADHLSYTRSRDHRNCLLIIKHFSLDEGSE
jgi:serine/threonine-protein kinase RsbW